MHGELTALACEASIAWRAWLNDAAQRYTSAIPGGDRVVRDLRSWLKCRLEETTPQAEFHSKVESAPGLMSLIEESFAIKRLRGRSHLGLLAPGEGRALAKVSSDGPPSLEIAIRPSSHARNRSVEAHEIAHFFYGVLAELRSGSEPVDHIQRTPAAERFCWEFALEASCGREHRKTWNAAAISSWLTPWERNACSQLRLRGWSALTFWHLQALARHEGISIRAAIAGLDRHRVLESAQIGIAVLRHMPNRVTGREPALRTWSAARPAWGFIPANKRAARQGFAHAEDAHNLGRALEPQLAQESLNVQHRSQAPGVRWRHQKLDTTCLYTAVDVKAEGRYLVAIWLWPPPSESLEQNQGCCRV